MPSRFIPSTGAVKEPVCSRAAEHSKKAASLDANGLEHMAILTKRQAASYLQTKNQKGRATFTESDREDWILMEKLASGDQSALDELYRKHKPTIEAFVHRELSLSDLDASDIVQEVFRRVQQKAWQYRPIGKVLSWIRKITQNLITDMVRQQLSRRWRETKYALARPPQGGEVEGPEAIVWEYGDAPSEEGGLCGKDMAYGDGEELHGVAVPCNFVIIPRGAGGDNLVWLGLFPVRRAKWGKIDRGRKWMKGGGEDSIRGMFRCFGLVPEDE
jgi:hypothetical protein